AERPADEARGEREELTRTATATSTNIPQHAEAPGAVMRALGRLPTSPSCRSSSPRVDTDGNGTMDFDEFYQVMLRYPKEQRLRFAPPAHHQGEPLTDEELDALLNTFPPMVTAANSTTASEIMINMLARYE
uniref:EF-hand domain-containing protein n=1 Tax=Macrostomum lignano TaxID=282301 RepID=A0A1I8JRQ7_9PLAT